MFDTVYVRVDWACVGGSGDGNVKWACAMKSGFRWRGVCAVEVAGGCGAAAYKGLAQGCASCPAYGTGGGGGLLLRHVESLSIPA